MFGFALVAFGIPLALAVVVWVRFLALDRDAPPHPWPLMLAVATISVSAAIWAFVLTWMSVANRNGGAILFGSPLSIPLLGLISWILCIAALICSFLHRKEAVNTRRLRNAIRLTSACLMLIWIMFLLDVH